MLLFYKVVVQHLFIQQVSVRHIKTLILLEPKDQAMNWVVIIIVISIIMALLLHGLLFAYSDIDNCYGPSCLSILTKCSFQKIAFEE